MPTISVDRASYLEDQLRESLRVIDTCLASIYAGNIHMYRALAGQLRQLLCDGKRHADNSLFVRVVPKLRVSRLRPIVWSASGTDQIELRQSREHQEARIASMPFVLRVFNNGLEIADLEYDVGTLVPIAEWIDQHVTVYPRPLSLRDVVRAVADKGGGAHVDKTPSADLRYLYQRTPRGRTYAEMLTIAIGRFVQRIGEGIFCYRGCRVPAEICGGVYQELTLAMVVHEDLAAALAS